MPGSCLSHAAARVGVHLRSPLQQYKNYANLEAYEGQSESDLSNEIIDLSMNRYLPESECGSRVMVVVDSNQEVKGALEWALSHTVQNRGIIILLHVSSKDKTNKGTDQKVYHLLQTTKNMCKVRRPEVHVDIVIREGEEKGATIVEAADQLRVSLLILGQWHQPFLWPLRIWMSRGMQSKVVDYCIKNANCMTIAVRRSRKYGGYLITTKRHKNFWLLA